MALSASLFLLLSEAHAQDAPHLAQRWGRTVPQTQAALQALVQSGLAQQDHASPLSGRQATVSARYRRHGWGSIWESCLSSVFKQGPVIEITLPKKQAQRLSAALELTARLGLWQLEALSREARWALSDDVSSHLVVVEASENELAQCKRELSGYSAHANAGVYNPRVPELFRQAFTAHQLLRHRLAWDASPEGGLGVDFGEPHRTDIALLVLSSPAPMGHTPTFDPTSPTTARSAELCYTVWATAHSLRVLQWAVEVSARVAQGRLDFLKHWLEQGALVPAETWTRLATKPEASGSSSLPQESAALLLERLLRAAPPSEPSSRTAVFLPLTSAALRHGQNNRSQALLQELALQLAQKAHLVQQPSAKLALTAPALVSPLYGWAEMGGQVYLVAQDPRTPDGLMLSGGSHSPQTALLKASQNKV